MSRYDGSDHYSYPGTSILINKAGFQDQESLDAFEADATAVRLLELIDRPILGQFDLAHLKAIHRHIFQDVYEWAGELRTVDIKKGNSSFASWVLIERYLDGKLAGIAKEDRLKALAPQPFFARLAHYMAEINATHPFREGNGRAQRAFCAQLAEEAGYFVNFNELAPVEMVRVMIESFNGDEAPLARVLERITALIQPDE
ncbi:hypothetical protein FNU76_17635 [Chitinimonas arctica]|uniref:protein adenylyltransferase n=1 Tax=Chitinimonas arctica TaxID=2594795 RepID=A0A516SIN7_9NEIS|nr:Fic family protein [Chitinimonas arctica]QDQ28020.1 hypothetical protein FNU76_17635 [Chitinimonas arctica]